MANNQKIADKRKANYQEGLEKNRANSAAQSHDSYMKGPEKMLAQSCKSYMKDLEKKVTKFTRKTWRRVAEMNWLGYILQK